MLLATGAIRWLMFTRPSRGLVAKYGNHSKEPPCIEPMTVQPSKRKIGLRKRKTVARKGDSP